jgi:Fur family ferric uptake transcriptional regulator
MLAEMADEAQPDPFARVKQEMIESARAELEALETAAEPGVAGGSWSQRARTAARRAGHNRGAARDVLIQLFADRDCALSVREIEDALQSRRPVGRASVYRALELLQDLKLIVRVDVGDGVVRYERAQDAGQHHHHHMLCDRCGLLIAFDDDQLESAIESLSERLGFETSGHEVTLRGTCVECRGGAMRAPSPA